MEWWSGGASGSTEAFRTFPITPSLHYSITPPLHHSNNPLPQNSIALFICPHCEQRERSTSVSSV